jgi:tetratricopeptide (TPR) repeat protein
VLYGDSSVVTGPTRLNNIGVVYKDWGKPEKALEYYEKALEIGVVPALLQPDTT